MSVLREQLDLRPYASHTSVFLSDDEATSEVDYGAWQEPVTQLRRVLVSPFELQVTTARYDTVPFIVRVWDSSAEVRYLVLPQRPEGTDDLTEEQLARLVDRDSMIGVKKVRAS